MANRTSLWTALGVACAAALAFNDLFAEDQLIDPKKITLTATRSVKARKIRKGVIPPEYGIENPVNDVAQDDKLDIVTIKVKVLNKTKKPLEGLKLICEFYGYKVGIGRKAVGKIGAEEAEVSFNAKGVFTCEFHKYTLYDKTKDVINMTTPDGASTPAKIIPPHGVAFFGYKVSLVSPSGRVLKTVSWPSKLPSMKVKDDFMDSGYVSPSKNPPGGEEGDNDGGGALDKGLKGLHNAL